MKTAWDRRRERRAKLVVRARKLHERGLSFQKIGMKLGVHGTSICRWL